MTQTDGGLRSGPALTYEQIEKWKDEFVDIAEKMVEYRLKIRELGMELEKLRSILTAASPFAPGLQKWIDQQQVSCTTISLTDAIQKVLEYAPLGMDRDEIKKHVVTVGYSEVKLNSSPNYFYTALRRLVERGRVTEKAGQFMLHKFVPS